MTMEGEYMQRNFNTKENLKEAKRLKEITIKDQGLEYQVKNNHLQHLECRVFFKYFSRLED